MIAHDLVQAAMLVIGIAMVLAFARLLRGPTLADRVVAFDLLTMQALGMICAAAILTGQWVFLDAAIILALLTFLATVAFARYLGRSAPGGDRDA